MPRNPGSSLTSVNRVPIAHMGIIHDIKLSEYPETAQWVLLYEPTERETGQVLY